ncbi:MAG: DUF192 domain-containing protein [Patescibacteria group bacterium]
MPQPYKDSLSTYKQLHVGEAVLNVEISDTQAKQTQGLSGRDYLDDNTGMLFVYTEPVKHNFWMKDVKFALDFIWITQGKVVQLDQNIPPPSSSAEEPARVWPQQDVDMVLEVPAGWISRQNIQVGDKVEYY